MSIDYRRGFIEVVPGIHEGHVSLEVFGIATRADVSDVEWVTDDRLTCSDVEDNSEIELTIDQAEALGQSLIAAANAARSQ